VEAQGFGRLPRYHPLAGCHPERVRRGGRVEGSRFCSREWEV